MDTLKIDRSFVSSLPDNEDDRTIVRAIMSIASNMGLEVVAEGVETKAQCNFLTSLGCRQLQGYYLGKPVPEETFIQGLLNHQKTKSYGQ